ncbi:MAG TPA: hypothetical protein VNZ68_12160 [Rhodocyclaceae bacterium]|nr:hypothetical protein [Rhodocyclaceae bacterium]
MHLVFFDTEFTDFQHADLISVALVGGDGRELYIAITDFKRHLVSDFVEENVLPRLELPTAAPTQATRAEAAQLVADFIQQTPGSCLVSDAEVDCTLLRGLLKKVRIRHPKFALAQNLVEIDQAMRLMEDLEQTLDEHPGRHNALIDARALRDAMARLSA